MKPCRTQELSSGQWVLAKAHPRGGDLGFLDVTQQFRRRFSLLGPIPVQPGASHSASHCHKKAVIFHFFKAPSSLIVLLGAIKLHSSQGCQTHLYM